MKVNKRSWHYRFNAKIQQEKFTWRVRDGRHTTCSYIRTTIYSALMALWFAAVFCIIGSIVGLAVGCMIVVPIIIFFFDGAPAEEFAFISALMWALVAFMLAVLTWKFLPKYLPKRDPNKEPNVFIQAIKDNHNKVCTRIEVV